MIKNYFKVAFRHLFQSKSYSIINLSGLTLGVTCCLLILCFVGYELSYDRFHENSDRILRLASTRSISGRVSEGAMTPPAYGPTLVAEFPEFLDAVRISTTVKRVYTYKDKTFFEEGVLYVDQSFPRIFSFEMTAGDPDTALEAPYTMVLTETTAKKYFGDQNPIGEKILWDNSTDYTVTGVMKDPPPNSHFTFNALASYATYIRYDPRLGTSWTSWFVRTYLLVEKNADQKQLEEKLTGFNEKYMGDQFENMKEELKISLQPLNKIHLYSQIEGELGVNGDIKMIYAFSAIAFVILLIACVNFMNLSTARSASRAREVGLRKVLGAERIKLVFQFLSESFLYALLSVAAAVILAAVLMPYFNVLADRPISLTILKPSLLTAGLSAMLIFIGLTAGGYPAFFLSSFQPITALRGRFSKKSKKSRLRSFLVIFQFAVSSFLMIVTSVIFAQQRYMKNKDLGFNKKNLLSIVIQNEGVRAGLDSLKAELLKIKGVENAGSSSMVPGEMYLFNTGIYPRGFDGGQRFVMDNFLVDGDFFDTFGIEIIAGRGFSKDNPTDVNEGVLINQTAVGKLGWDVPVGQIIEMDNPQDADSNRRVSRRVIGVFADIHQRSLYSPIQPTLLEHVKFAGPIENRPRRLTLRLRAYDMETTLAQIELTWKEVFPNEAYYSFFLDEFFESRHRAEVKLGNIFRAFSFLAVLIGCVGLFGMASFIAERRTKEIGIRKILGSSAFSILVLLCRDFIIPVVIANILAWPVAYYAVTKWLQNFPYKINPGLGLFALTGLLTLAIAMFSVGGKSFKAARSNPIESLRYE